MKGYLRNWNFMRLLRLALGIFIIVQGVQTKEWLLVALGGLFSLMPLLPIHTTAPFTAQLWADFYSRFFRTIKTKQYDISGTHQSG